MNEPDAGGAWWQALQSMPAWEALAVVLGIVYLLLAMRENLWCWYAAFASTAIFLVIFREVNLLMESALQLYYLGMAVYGWWQWQHGSDATTELKISSWNRRQHTIAIGSTVALSICSAIALGKWTDAALPLLDSFTTWGSVITTWMVARKILENWLYWLVIDSVSIYLYLDRELYFTVALFAIYLVIVIFGYRQWRSHYLATSS